MYSNSGSNSKDDVLVNLTLKVIIQERDIHIKYISLLNVFVFLNNTSHILTKQYST